MWTPGVRRDDTTLSADPTITVSIRPWSSPVVSARLTAVLMPLDEARGVRSFESDDPEHFLHGCVLPLDGCCQLSAACRPAWSRTSYAISSAAKGVLCDG